MTNTADRNRSAFQRLTRFSRQQGGDLRLAQHAALPVVLSPDLLHLVRINFLLDKDPSLDSQVDQAPPPYTAESDLLLSPLCQEIGDNLYEMDPAVRELLLRDLVSHHGTERLREVATLLWQYSQGHSDWSGRPGLERAQQFTALNILDPAQAREWLKAAEAQAGQTDAPVDKEWFLAMERERTAAESALQIVEQPAPSPIPEEAEEAFDYERGLARLASILAGNNTRLAEFELYCRRLRDNLRAERRFGATETTRAERVTIIAWLNSVSMAEQSISFLELCRTIQIESPTSDQLSDQQREHLEKLLQIDEAAGGSEKRDALLRDADEFVRRGEYDRAQLLSEQALALSRQTRDRAIEARALSNIALIQQSKGNLVEARQLYDKAAIIFLDLDNQVSYAQVMNQLGIIFQTEGDLEGARHRYEQALTLFQRHADRINEGSTLQQLGTLFQLQGDVEQARNSYGKALDIASATGDRLSESRALFRLGELAQQEGDYRTARECYIRSIDIERKLNNKIQLSRTLNRFGLLLQQQRDYTHARSIFEEVVALNRAIFGEQHPYTASSLYNLGGLLQAQGDFDGARLLYQQALAIYEAALDGEDPTANSIRANIAALDTRDRQETRKESKDEMLTTLKEGDIRSGVVTSIADFGAFVDIGGAEGLVHLSELSWGRVKHPKEVLKLGDRVNVYVLGVDRKRIALSIKRAQNDPWSTVRDRYQLGQIVEGTVTQLASFGAFVRIEDGLEALLHISEIGDGRIERISDILQEGDTVQARVIRLDPVRKRMGLSMRQTVEEKIDQQHKLLAQHRATLEVLLRQVAMNGEINIISPSSRKNIDEVRRNIQRTKAWLRDHGEKVEDLPDDIQLTFDAQGNIQTQLESLQTERKKLAELIRQQAELGLFVHPSVLAGMSEARRNITKIKQILVGMGVTVADHPDDRSTSSDLEQSGDWTIPVLYSQQPVASTPRLPTIGDIFAGKVAAVDDTAVLITIPGFSEDNAVGVIKAGNITDGHTDRYRTGNAARVEVIAIRTLKSGRTVIELKPATKQQKK